MTVGELKERLADLPDRTPVLVQNWVPLELREVVFAQSFEWQFIVSGADPFDPDW